MEAKTDDDDGLMATVQNACRDLPDGFEVNLCMENGAAWVELWSVDHAGGERIEVPELDLGLHDTTLQEQIKAAVREANHLKLGDTDAK